MIPVRHCCRCSSPRQFRCQHAPAPVRPRRHATPRRLRFSTPHASLVRRTSSGLAKTASSSLFFSYRRSLRSFFGTQPADKEQGISAESFLILSFPFCHSWSCPSFVLEKLHPAHPSRHTRPPCLRCPHLLPEPRSRFLGTCRSLSTASPLGAARSGHHPGLSASQLATQ